MGYAEITRVSFTVDGFQRGQVASRAGIFSRLLPGEPLGAIDHLIAVRHGSPPYRVVLGVPHHAAPGAECICERRLDAQGRPDPREADENAALYALAAFAALSELGESCKLVVMAHTTTHDPNKVLDSPYCQEIFSEPAGLIFECHGSRRERRLDLELSAGRNPLPDTQAFGRLLAKALGYRYSLGVQIEPARRQALVWERGGEQSDGELELPARKTLSLIEAGRRSIQALHLEARPRFRRQAPEGGISPEGLALGDAIARTIVRYLAK
jgi:hypothetical protein